ncbi:putative bifunctional diguanylate cyclase/phosphodiesterase [Methylocystis iwaonis]|uniref:putative bifunctional diguanylate cyclase/phosphodiesterase n=1 Tax=Methylocystis iwaonis TaxID=2885079 RepID=UPI002E7B1DA2|nr:EAL domain-containing protein [Methylocystis iwaonis]
MGREIAAKFVRLFQAPTDDMELVRAQFHAFAKQIPLLYIILSINTAAVVFTFAKFGHPWISLYLPLALCLAGLGRGVTWWRIGRAAVSDDVVVLYMRRTNRLAFISALAFIAWGMALFPYGDAYAQGQLVFFLGLSLISGAFCLMHLRSAALSVTLFGVAPFSIYFFFAEEGHFRSAAINLALVSLGMIVILMIYNRDFANLVSSRRSLLEKQEETQRLSEENLRLANLDALSGLPNRRALMSQLEEMHRASGEAHTQIAVIFVDLDGFKDVNDAYGHETGDRVIEIVAAELQRLLPEGAVLARLGGDEFAALISASDAAAQADMFAARVVANLTEPIRIRERAVQIGASVGIACAPQGACDAGELFRRADAAMYDVKENGKAGVRVYSAALDAARHRQQELEGEIRQGLIDGQFEVFYQPIVDAEGKDIVSVEALLRWPRRPAGAIGPDQFICVAEASGLINPLGLFVLRRACQDILEAKGLNLSVNVSPAQFRDPDFEAKIAAVLAETGFPAQRLEFELTESYLIDHPERAMAVIASLKGMGVSIALDDFGVGYTSIAYLQRYGFDRIKIDKSLAGRVATDKKAGVLVAGAIYIANGLDMAVTAEGVETEEQADLLRLAGCQCLQGFRYSEPKPIDEIRDWLTERRGDAAA